MSNRLVWKVRTVILKLMGYGLWNCTLSTGCESLRRKQEI